MDKYKMFELSDWDKGQPMHWNCRCTIGPAKQDLTQDIIDTIEKFITKRCLRVLSVNAVIENAMNS